MQEIISFLDDLSGKNNIKIYLVGGYVRDILLGKKSKNINLIVDRNIDLILNELKNNFNITYYETEDIYNSYKTQIKDIEISFSLMNGKTIEDDLKKRDFTINSIAVDVLNIDSLDDIHKDTLIDPTDGYNDIKLETLRAVNDDIFINSPIRILRAIRLISQLKFELDKNTTNLIVTNKNNISKINNNFLSDELFKLLKLQKTYTYFVHMDKLGILEYIFPEIISMKDVGECKYHVVDSFTHSIYTLKLAEEIIYSDGFFEEHLKKQYENHCNEIITENRTRIELIKLGAFFHDVGKPTAKWVDETGRVRFRGHEVTGAEIIVDIAKRLLLSEKEQDILYRIVNKHMLPLVSYKSNDVSGNALFDIFSKCKDETLDILLIALADIVATRKLLFPDEEMGKFKVHIEYMANNYLTRYKEIEDISNIITIDEIKDILNIKNEKAKEVLESIKKRIYVSEIAKKKEKVIEYLKSNYKL